MAFSYKFLLIMFNYYRIVNLRCEFSGGSHVSASNTPTTIEYKDNNPYIQCNQRLKDQHIPKLDYNVSCLQHGCMHTQKSVKRARTLVQLVNSLLTINILESKNKGDTFCFVVLF